MLDNVNTIDYFVVMKRNMPYSIRYVVQQTGLKPHILRTWERRYGAVKPQRSDTNRRLYTSGDIRRLRLLKTAVNCGHTISQIASLENKELAELIDRAATLHAQGTGARVNEPVSDDVEQIIIQALAHVRKLDQNSLERVLENAAIKLPRSRFLDSVVHPLFEKIGSLWASGEMKIIHERLATIVTRSLLIDMLRTAVVADAVQRIVVAAPVGQWHETGALIVALSAAEAGWQPLYFGPNLPAEDIAAGIQKTASRAAALSICHRSNSAIVLRELRRLQHYCGKQAKIFVGGQGVAGLQHRVQSIGVVYLQSPAMLKSALSAATT
jgi:DNA-binding transcriptional MerR regulator